MPTIKDYLADPHTPYDEQAGREAFETNLDNPRIPALATLLLVAERLIDSLDPISRLVLEDSIYDSVLDSLVTLGVDPAELVSATLGLAFATGTNFDGVGGHAEEMAQTLNELLEARDLVSE